ncbi:hypothetical protein B0T16DRAFT_198988 [Cercophora newfieldiana]|uniref:RRM domain-containing protein n=1 Tax=Cercophora newfieldiana TaxID=92897 RepID=A0AA40CP91_9PEZI|nr:hypothetical protein B0T16DRAFT_198988 [Cercophora newfieldiana]
MTATTSSDANPDSAALVRLHISPLDPDLLTVVLSSTLLPKARNISYHSLETFPEKRYGFVELPAEDAEKLKRKLSGAVVKGNKIRIERARPASLPEPLGDAAMAKNKEKRGDGEVDVSKHKKRKRDAEIEGIVLEEGRKVKRGWTTVEDPKDKKARKDKRDKKEKGEKKEKEKEKKKRTKSKYTDHEECLVKTILPAEGAASADATDATSKKKKSKSREVVVHEFEKTTKFPTFLKATVTTSRKPPVEFVDGKGWVDEDGNIVDDSKTNSKPPPKAVAVIKAKPKAQKPESDSDDSSEADSSEGESSDSDSDEETEDAPVVEDTAAAPAAEVQPESPVASPSLSKSEPARPKSSGSIRNLTIQIPPATPPKEAKVHPLEALYKRPAPVDGQEAQASAEGAGFSFFSNGGNEDLDEDMEESHEIHVPMTPFTRQDVETRGIRSAAPTPDTAHPAGRFKPWAQEEDDIDEDEDEDGESGKDDVDGLSDGAPDAAGSSEAPTSDFQKWFWENRGNINRSWRKRRKTVGKEKRYRENRARMARAI